MRNSPGAYILFKIQPRVGGLLLASSKRLLQDLELVASKIIWARITRPMIDKLCCLEGRYYFLDKEINTSYVVYNAKQCKDRSYYHATASL